MKALLQNSLFLRIISALVLIPIVFWAVFNGDPVPFYIMVGVCLGLAVSEWLSMVRHSTHRALRGTLGVLYLLIGFISFIYIHKEWGYTYTLSLLLTIWASDIGAYFAGKAIGGPKMAPSISPKKTWSGFVGGMIASGLAMYFYYRHCASSASLTELKFFSEIHIQYFMPAWGMFLIGMGVTVVGQAGDLLESWQKRSINVKDSGNLIPGHGGILDRIDSLLLAAPCFLILLEVLRHG